MFISRKTVIASIDVSDPQKPVEIRYVRRDGTIAEMKICKTEQRAKKSPDASEGATTKYMIRDRGLIRVLDLAKSTPKSLFIYAIIAFKPFGTPQFITVNHE